MNIKNPQANGLLYFLHLRLVYNRNQGFVSGPKPINTKPKNDHKFRLLYIIILKLTKNHLSKPKLENANKFSKNLTPKPGFSLRLS